MARAHDTERGIDEQSVIMSNVGQASLATQKMRLTATRTDPRHHHGNE